MHAPAAASRTDRPGLGALCTAVLIVAVLSRAQAIFVPLALAVVVAFALGPAVRLFERALGRVAAVTSSNGRSSTCPLR